MQRMRVPLRPGSRAKAEGTPRQTRTAPAWEWEWTAAQAAERQEAGREAARRTRRAVVWIAPAAVLAGLLPAIFPLTPGFSEADTLAAVVAATVTAAVALAIVPLTAMLARGLGRAGTRDALIFSVALLSAGAAAIHFAVVKMHFDEYTLFGVFFVGAGIAQLVWPIWLLLSRWRLLLAVGALGNGLIVAMWGVDRIWGLPLGPEHWKPEPVGFGDGVTAAFELLLVAGCLTRFARDREWGLHLSAAAALTVAVTALTALSLLSVLALGSSFLTPTA